jgi:hypothetical protein
MNGFLDRHHPYRNHRFIHDVHLQGLTELATFLNTILTDPKKMKNRELFQTVFLLATPSAVVDSRLRITEAVKGIS